MRHYNLDFPNGRQIALRAHPISPLAKLWLLTLILPGKKNSHFYLLWGLHGPQKPKCVPLKVIRVGDYLRFNVNIASPARNVQQNSL